MRILIPVPSFEAAGGFRVLSVLATHLLRAGHRVAFLVDHRSGPPYFPTEADVLRYRVDGSIDAAPAGARSFARSGNAPSIYLGMLRALGRIGRDYDVVLANHSFTAWPVALARTGSARKWYYVQAYEPDFYAETAGWRGRLLRAVSWTSYKLGLATVVNAPIYREYGPIVARDWVPPGIDREVFATRTAPPLATKDREIVIGTIGRREPYKGTGFVLEAFEVLAASDPRYRLRVAFGNLPEGWAHPRCEVVQPDSDAALAAFYRSVDIVVAAGTIQLGACHYPILEAMSCGTPVVCTRYVPADGSTAWVVPVEDSPAIVAAVRAIVAADPLEVAARVAAASAAVRRFGWPEVAAQFGAVLSGSSRRTERDPR